MIDSRAIVHPSAVLADDVSVGPWSIIGPGVTIGEGTEISSHVVIKANTRIGKNNQVYQFASVGEDPAVPCIVGRLPAAHTPALVTITC